LLGALGGSLVADLLWYGIGRRWRHWIHGTTAADRARDLFLAHRLGALVIGKFFFEVNAAIAALAGSSGIRVGEFLVYDAAGALLWAGAWTGLGYVLQDGMKEATTMLAPLSMLSSRWSGRWRYSLPSNTPGAGECWQMTARSRRPGRESRTGRLVTRPPSARGI
jgi:hypothetical protein